MINRTFHPVGQGAFYSECHSDGFNIVYDCGNLRNTKPADKIVEQSFIKGEVIDILFISHFDYDHVSKIRTLKEHAKIKKVIMPCLHSHEKNLLIKIYEALELEIASMISDPQDYFGGDTQVIITSLSDNNERPVGGDNAETQDIDGTIASTIESGSILKKTIKGYDWIYIPFNYDYKNRNNNLESLLCIEGFDVGKLKNDPDYAIASSISNRRKLKEIYDKLDGNINQNSMMVYSGPLKAGTHMHKHVYPLYNFKYYYPHHRIYHNSNRVSCIFTGDSDFNIVNPQIIYKNYWDNVGTIQIPHHGSLKNFHLSAIDKNSFCCPISVGNRNNFGHPSSRVIADIISKHSLPIKVTENLSSQYIEIIK